MIKTDLNISMVNKKLEELMLINYKRGAEGKEPSLMNSTNISELDIVNAILQRAYDLGAEKKKAPSTTAMAKRAAQKVQIHTRQV